MGGAFIAIPGDLNSIYYNPAGLAEVSQKKGTFTYLNHLLDFWSGFIAYGGPYEDLGVLGFGLNYFDYGELQRFDEAGNQRGSFGARDFALTFSLARVFNKNILLGFNIKLISSFIENYAAYAVAIDLGGIYHTPMEGLDVGIGIFNLGKSLKAFINTREELPLNYRLGFSKRLAHLPLLISFDLYKYEDLYWALGGEFTVTEGVFLRLGFNSIGREEKIDSGNAGVSFGLGIQWRAYQLDYSLSSLGEIGSLNRISLTASF